MINTKRGYMFQAQNSGDMFGIKEEFKSVRRGDMLLTKAIFGIDANGIPLSPAIFRGTKFRGLYDYLNSVPDAEAEFDKFLRSKKPTYSVSTALFLICVADICYNCTTRTYEQGTKVDFFMVSNYGEVQEYGFVVFSNILRPFAGVNTACVAQPVIDNMTRVVLSILPICLLSRKDFIENRLH